LAIPVRLGTAASVITYDTDYMLQVSQLAAVQLPQGSPPIGEVNPSSLVVKEAKRDNTRSALSLHLGQEAPSVAWLNGRKSSNLTSQAGQTYSYIGIFFLHN